MDRELFWSLQQTALKVLIPKYQEQKLVLCMRGCWNTGWTSAPPLDMVEAGQRVVGMVTRDEAARLCLNRTKQAVRVNWRWGRARNSPSTTSTHEGLPPANLHVPKQGHQLETNKYMSLWGTKFLIQTTPAPFSLLIWSAFKGWPSHNRTLAQDLKGKGVTMPLPVLIWHRHSV